MDTQQECEIPLCSLDGGASRRSPASAPPPPLPRKPSPEVTTRLSLSPQRVLRPVQPAPIGITEVGVTVRPTAPPTALPLATADYIKPPPDDPQDETDEEVAATFDRIVEKASIVIPNKSHVLYYFSGASLFNMRRVGSDLQITDPADFPLLDVWVEMDCCKCTWLIEAYGKVVLVMHEQPARFCCGARRPPITVTDWNGDLFGHLVPGDPFLLQSPDRATVAKIVPHSTEAAATSALDDAQGADASAAALSYICVLEGSGRHIARVDNFETIQYNKDVTFQLKLLALAGIIRLSAPFTMPGRGENQAIEGFWRVVSTLLNFFAYCFY